MPTVYSITLSGKDLSQLKLRWQKYGAVETQVYSSEASVWVKRAKQEVVDFFN
ncbi:hypothetical protein [Nostoc sp.]|uniref:hypothetical protein n=1 Tax=Nostoc sp. TaxID=1180 RepID=UPI002FFC27CE